MYTFSSPTIAKINPWRSLRLERSGRLIFKDFMRKHRFHHRFDREMGGVDDNRVVGGF
jgi:Mn-dependent DtxR family transcriptional regulator